MDNLKITYDKIAQDWHQDHINDDWWYVVMNRLISMIPVGASVLDLGCGAGHQSKYFADRGFKVTGVDLSEEMVKISQHEVPNAKFHVLDLHDVDSLLEKWDCVCANAVLLHIPKTEIPSVLEKISHVLAPSGLLYVSVKESNTGLLDERIEIESDYGYEYKRFFSYYTQNEMDSYLKDIGMEIVYSGITSSGKTNWIQVIAKKSR
jgi:2-polyprenyl-3-methyl-5-hydroxy-6-metoxy-1,4-benzoquinol methylase